MADETPAPDLDVVPASAISIPETTDSSPVDIRTAADALSKYRLKRDKEQTETPPAEAPEPAAEPPPEPLPEGDAAPVEEATGETATTEPTEESPIEPPRSWTKEEKETFKSYPRDLQETLSRREQERETNLRRGQNELAEQRKAYESKQSAVEQARLQYEQALPALLQTLSEQQQGAFADIKTMADVEKLAREDWPRYALWDAQQKKIAAVQQEVQASQTRQQQDFTQKWQEYTTKEDALFLEQHPEMTTDKGKELATATIQVLKDAGFGQEDLSKLWTGQASLSLRDHRAQEIALKAAKWDQAQRQVSQKVAKTVPTVQRPGVSPPKGQDADIRLKNLEKALERTGSLKDATAFLKARRSSG